MHNVIVCCFALHWVAAPQFHTNQLQQNGAAEAMPDSVCALAAVSRHYTEPNVCLCVLFLLFSFEVQFCLLVLSLRHM